MSFHWNITLWKLRYFPKILKISRSQYGRRISKYLDIIKKRGNFGPVRKMRKHITERRRFEMSDDRRKCALWMKVEGWNRNIGQKGRHVFIQIQIWRYFSLKICEFSQIALFCIEMFFMWSNSEKLNYKLNYC